MATTLSVGLLLQILIPTIGALPSAAAAPRIARPREPSAGPAFTPTSTATPKPSPKGHIRPGGGIQPGVSGDTLTFQISALPFPGAPNPCTSVTIAIDGVNLGNYDSNTNSGPGYNWTSIFIDVTAEFADPSPHDISWRYTNVDGCTSATSMRNLSIGDGSGNVYYDEYHPIYDNQVVAVSGCYTSCTGAANEQIDLSTGQFVLDGGGTGPVNQYVSTGAALPSTTLGPTNPAQKNKAKCVQGDPVDCATGNFYEAVTDLNVAGRGRALSFARTYNALAAVAATGTVSGGIGWGWSDSYGDSLSFGTGAVTVTQDDGATAAFTQSGSSYVPAPGVYATLVANADGTYTFTLANQQADVFNASGQLVTETDRNGYATVVSYSGGRISAVTDPAGRQLSFSYNAGGQISRVTDC